MKASDFYDIYDFIYVPFWKTNTFIACAVFVGLIACAIAGYLFYKRYKKEIAKPITPKEWALGELAKLTPQKYQTKEEFKKFYFALGSIFKGYLKEEKGWDLLEKTDTELLDILIQKGVDQEILSILKKIFEGSLLIKFANAEALRTQALEDLKSMIKIYAN